MRWNYTNYFSMLIKEQGIPQFTPEYFRKMMNIVYLEGSIIGIRKIKEQNRNTKDYHKYDLIIFRFEKQLTEITQNVEPSEMIELWFRFMGTK